MLLGVVFRHESILRCDGDIGIGGERMGMDTRELVEWGLLVVSGGVELDGGDEELGWPGDEFKDELEEEEEVC